MYDDIAFEGVLLSGLNNLVTSVKIHLASAKIMCLNAIMIHKSFHSLAATATRFPIDISHM